MRSRRFSQSGATLIEAMVAGVMVTSLALSIYPVVVHSKKLIKHADFYDLCINAARAKMNEYKWGKRTTLNGTLTADMSLTESIAGGPTNTGFAYAKSQYNLFPPSSALTGTYCPADVGSGAPFARTVPLMPPANLGDLGIQECIIGTGPPPAGCTSAIDTLMTSQLPKFKIFVNLRRYNPVMNIEDCAWNDATTTNNYDFQQSEDMIKVTVTALLDTTLWAAGQNYAGIAAGSTRISELTCQISDFIRPPSQVARYWLQADGHIFRWLGTGVSGGGLTQWEVFQSLYLGGPNGNKGIAVSPDNKYAFILRPGKLIRFGPCGGDPLDCPTAGALEWDINPNIVSIGAKFLYLATDTRATNDPLAFGGTNAVNCGAPSAGLPVIYGLASDHQTVYCFTLPAAGGTIPGGNYGAVVTTNANGAQNAGPFILPNNSSRVHSIFMDPTGASTYVVDLSCWQFNGQTYCGGIYNSTDVNLQYPLEIFNVRAVAFSK
jgi:hypothetical protein